MAAPTLGGKFPLDTIWARELLTLPANWDSYGGKPISAEALKTLGSFSVVPCFDGGIQLEAHRDGLDIEIEIGPDGKLRSSDE